MIGRRGRKAHTRQTRSWRLAPGTRAYAVGDIHGRADLLERMISAVGSDLATRPVSGNSHLIFVGDYVDRGPSASEVIARLSTLTIDNARIVCLRGNHEQVMLDFLADPRLGPQWCSFGGDATLASYGVGLPRLRTRSQGWEETRNALAGAMPASHLEFLKALPLSFTLGSYLFVHAGVDPDTPIGSQGAAEFLWQREPFLSDRKPLQYCIVHGHTPVTSPYRDHRRIGLDTGAYASGVLSGVCLEDESASFIQV